MVTSQPGLSPSAPRGARGYYRHLRGVSKVWITRETQQHTFTIHGLGANYFTIHCVFCLRTRGWVQRCCVTQQKQPQAPLKLLKQEAALCSRDPELVQETMPITAESAIRQ